jgi:hypothetical protein
MMANKPDQMTKSFIREDTWIDVGLDFIRDHRMPAFLEVLISWCIALFRLIHYTSTYYLEPTPPAKAATIRRIPLMTHARIRKPVEETALTLHEQLVTRLKELSTEADSLSLSLSSSSWPPNQLVALIRSDKRLRRLVSMLMTTPGAESTALYQQLDDIWSDLLPLPSIQLLGAAATDVAVTPDGKRIWKHSLVLPAYRERGQSIVHTLQCALESCRDPANIQVVVVDAGQCTDLEAIDKLQAIHKNSTNGKSSNHQWGEITLVHTSGGGRGPTLNYGAECTNGTILTFLHSDVILPADWDAKIQETLIPSPSPSTDKSSSSSVVHACAFSFGTNLSEQGLEGMGYPWGIQAVHFTVGLRTSRLKLPYGDNVISIPTAYFNYLGGFPNQPIMEDYSLMDLLRTRAKVLPETLVIVPHSTVRRRAMCVCVCVYDMFHSALVGIRRVCVSLRICCIIYSLYSAFLMILMLFSIVIHVVGRLFARPDDGKSLAWFTPRW